MTMKFHFAPVQGHTDAPYRSFHSSIYGAVTDYYTPFIRLEKEGVRQRDLKDMTSALNAGHHLVPQIIFRDASELTALVGILKDEGVAEIDLNMGCPFPLQTGHGRGAATVADDALGDAVVATVESNPDISFSVKMRLGMKNPDEWIRLIPKLNKVNLSHIAVHPRVARQQYGGDLLLDSFRELLSVSTNPVVYNGELRTPEDIQRVVDDFPGIAGIMIGRGLLGRPSLVAEYLSGKEWSREMRLERMLEFHRVLLDHYSSTLCGESQVINKIKPFWEYAEEEIGRKAWKTIKKAGNIAKYHSGVAMISAE